MSKSYLDQPGLPRGLRNNNPGNLIGGGNWKGLIGYDAQGFNRFENIGYGLRALAIDLSNKIKHGFNTIELIIYKFAPPSENDTEAYIDNVCYYTGLSRDQELTADGATLAKLMHGIITVELGSQYAGYITTSDINEGISMMGTDIVGPVGFSLATGLFLVALYALFTMPTMNKKKSKSSYA